MMTGAASEIVAILEQPGPMRIFSGLAIPAAGTYELDVLHAFVMSKAQNLVVGRVRGRFNSTTGRVVVADHPL